MPARSAKKPKEKKQDEAALYAALFALIEKKGWGSLTLPAIARAAKIKLPLLMEKYGDKNGLLTSFGAYLDREVAAHAEEGDAPLKEKLFSMLMARFDVLQKFRGGMIRLISDMQLRPISAALLGLEAGPQLCRSMQRMLDAAGLPSGTASSILYSCALKLVYMNAVRVWRNDASRDMAATMAALDRSLEMFLKLLPSKA